MSFEKFDKFCAKMVNNDPIEPEKDVYDERQQQLRQKLTLEAFRLYAVLSFIAMIIYECAYQFCESAVPVLALLMAVCYLVWIIRSSVKGTLLGVKYGGMKYTAIYVLIEIPFFVWILADGFFEEKAPASFFISNGQLTDGFMLCIAAAVFLASSVVVLAAVKKRSREEVAD